VTRPGQQRAIAKVCNWASRKTDIRLQKVLQRVPGYSAEAWFVLVAPAGTPQPTIDRLSAEVDRILKKPEVAERFAKLGATPVGGTPRQLGDFIDAETCKWQQVVKVSDAKVD